MGRIPSLYYKLTRIQESWRAPLFSQNECLSVRTVSFRRVSEHMECAHSCSDILYSVLRAYQIDFP